VIRRFNQHTAVLKLSGEKIGSAEKISAVIGPLAVAVPRVGRRKT
jgi:hypothetical protein